jgi:hypothetical protein
VGVLQSRLFTDANALCLDDELVDDTSKKLIRDKKLDVTKRLELAATVDPQHILNPQRGAHVRMIHRALIKLRNAPPITVDGSNLPEEEVEAYNRMISDLRKAPQISESELKSTTYGPTTAAVVKAYKVSRDIRRTPKSAVDNVVGIQTTRAIDTDLIIADGRPIPPRPAPAGKPQDIFIRFNPIANLAQEGQEDPVTFQEVKKAFDTEEYRRSHKELRIITFFGGRGPKDPSDRAVQIAELTRSTTPAGKTIIVGASAGGFSVLNTASKLTARGISISFVGIADGGFFVDSTPSDIEKFGTPPAFATPPTIRLPGVITADETLNVFQTFGLTVLGKKSAPNDQGIAPGAEWYGEMTGFNNQRLTPQNNATLGALQRKFAVFPGDDVDRTLVVRKKLFSDPAHVEAVAEGERRIGSIVKRLLAPDEDEE